MPPPGIAVMTLAEHIGSSLLRLWRLAPRKMRRLFLHGLAFRMLQSLCLAGMFCIVGIWSNAFVTGVTPSPGAIVATCLAALLMLVLQFVFACRSVSRIWNTSFRLVGAIRHRLLRHLVDLPMTFHLSRTKGDLVNALTSDLSLIENLLTDGLPRLVHSLSLPIFILVLICFVDPATAALATLPIIAALPLLLFSCSRLARLSGEKQAAQADATSKVLEWVEGMPTVRSFGIPGNRRNAYGAPLEEIYRISVRMVAKLTMPLLGFAAVVMSGPAVVVAVAGYRHDIDALSAGQVSAILILSLPLYVPLLGLAQFIEFAAVAQEGIDRLNAIMAAKPARLAAHGVPLGHAVTCEGAGFRYFSTHHAVRPVSLQIPEGGLTAVIGPSGAGKSTLLLLLAGLLQPTEGRILIGGVDVANICPADLDRLISVVFQDVIVFSGTVRDNIAMGKPGATHAEIERAAKAASAHAFIQALDHGYDTQIGEAGLILSGGERQRLSLARAILKDTPIILVDEGTASVDKLTSRAIDRALKELARTRSVIVVTHDLRVLDDAERIVDLGGRQYCPLLEAGRRVDRDAITSPARLP